jgi:MFS family permease
MARWLPDITVEAWPLILTRSLRGFADGVVSVVLPLYLAGIGYGSFAISAIVFGTLLGSAVLTLAVGLLGNRVDPRRILIWASSLMVATGLGFFTFVGFYPLFIVAVVGTLNPSAGDVSLFLPAEQSALSESVELTRLTHTFAVYNLGGAIAGAFGALASGLPTLVASRYGLRVVNTQRIVFLVYAAIALIAGTVYRQLPPTHEPVRASRPQPLTRSRAIVIKLSALFCIDAFGGGFVVQSLLALWLLRRFNMHAATVGVFFFLANGCGAFAQLLSSPLAARIGRIRTMAYTHIPSNVFLILAALAPDANLALGFLFLRAATSPMDVPARQSYVMAVVAPEERAAAAGVTNVPRSLASAFAPLPAGAMLEASPFGWPLVCAGALKILYDFVLLAQFRAIRPIDES